MKTQAVGRVWNPWWSPSFWHVFSNETVRNYAVTCFLWYCTVSMSCVTESIKHLIKMQVFDRSRKAYVISDKKTWWCFIRCFIKIHPTDPNDCNLLAVDCMNINEFKNSLRNFKGAVPSQNVIKHWELPSNCVKGRNNTATTKDDMGGQTWSDQNGLKFKFLETC